MKRIISVLMALCIVLTSLFTGVYAMAEEKATPTTKEKIKTQMLGAADYLVNDSDIFTTDNADSFYKYLRSGKDMSKFKESFVESVKKNLDDNNGKLLAAHTEWVEDANGNWSSEISYVESAATYGAVILAMNELKLDYKAFEGYNIASSFSKVDVSKLNDNPYLYTYSISGALLSGNEKLAKALCDKLIADYYTTDKGVDYYGFSCDNTCAFINALAPCYNDYKATVDNALKVIESYKLKDGYAHMTTDEAGNCNSTAYAVLAYACVGNTEKAMEAYKLLCTFESKTKAGIFTYDKEDNAFATSDALTALITLNTIIPICYDGHKYVETVKAATCTENGFTTYTCSVCNDTYTGKIVVAAGHNFANNSYTCSVCNEINPNYVLPKVTGLATKSRNTKSVRIIWNKVDGADSYIIYKYDFSSGNYESIAQIDASKTDYKATGLKAGQINKFKVAAVRNKKISAKSSYLKTTAKPNKSSIKSIKSSAKKKFTVKFASKVCTGYEIQWSTTKNFSSNYKSVKVDSSALTNTISTSQSKRKYYVRVRAYTQAGGEKVYGKWSAVKSITVK